MMSSLWIFVILPASFLAAISSSLQTNGAFECDIFGSNRILNCSERRLIALPDAKQWDGLLALNISFGIMDFSENYIDEVVVMPAVRVASLNLEHNEIRRVRKNAFQHLKEVQTIDLSYNMITTDRLLQGDPSCKVNSTSNSSVPESEVDATALMKLRELNLAHNRLCSLHPNTFEKMSQLETLNLSWNQFKTFDDDSFAAMALVPKLTTLDLSYNKMDHLYKPPDNILSNLRLLDLSGNMFYIVPFTLSGFTGLRSLIFDDNPVDLMGPKGSFPDLPSLKALRMNNIQNLTHISEGALGRMPALTWLSISFCPNFFSLDPRAFYKTVGRDLEPNTELHLKMLILEGNMLHYFDKNLLVNWDNLTHINLQNNPWRCQPDNQFLVKEIIPKIKSGLTDNLYCVRDGEKSSFSEPKHWKLKGTLFFIAVSAIAAAFAALCAFLVWVKRPKKQPYLTLST